MKVKKNMIDHKFFTVGIEIDILSKENFLKIKETLSRIGVSKKLEKTLIQSAHILHKRDSNGNSRYAIVHFKEMFLLDKKQTEISKDDYARRNLIADLLEEWGLCKILVPDFDTGDMLDLNSVKIISVKEKSEWKLVPKYTIGKH